MSETFKDHFSAQSAAYADFRPRYPDTLAQYLAALAPDRTLALDAGCGNGQLTTLLAAYFDKVIGIDASAQQIAKAEPRTNITYRVAPAHKSGVADRSVALATVAQAAHWFDLEAFYAEMRRVVIPGGILALISYGVTKLDGAAGAVIDHFYTDVLGGYWPPERASVEKGYRDLSFPFAEFDAPALNMSAQWSVDQLIGYVSTWSAVQALKQAKGDAPYEEFIIDIKAAWGDPQEKHEIHWPLSFRIARL